MTKQEGDYYKGYPVINTDNQAPIIKRLIDPDTHANPQKLEVTVPLEYDIEKIPQGRTPIVWGRVNHINPNGQAGEFDGNIIVKVLDGFPIQILVPQSKVHKISSE